MQCSRVSKCHVSIWVPVDPGFYLFISSCVLPRSPDLSVSRLNSSPITRSRVTSHDPMPNAQCHESTIHPSSSSRKEGRNHWHWTEQERQGMLDCVIKTAQLAIFREWLSLTTGTKKRMLDNGNERVYSGHFQVPVCGSGFYNLGRYDRTICFLIVWLIWRYCL